MRTAAVKSALWVNTLEAPADRYGRERITKTVFTGSIDVGQEFRCACCGGSSAVRIGAVKLSVKSDYATRAVLGLARLGQSGNAVRVETLADSQNIPPNYLVQILIELKSTQIVKSLRGKEGGYFLARPPAQITLGDVIRCVHGQVFDSPALSDPHCPPELKAAWQVLQETLNKAADQITFQQLLDEGAHKEKMYYI